MNKGLSIRDALDTILSSVSPMPFVRLSLREAAGYVLAEDVTALDDIPFTPNSAMDGFAVRVLDLQTASRSNPIKLRIAAEMAAAGLEKPTGGGTFPLAVAHGMAVKIMTGASIPSGGDAVVPIEHVTIDGDTAIFDEPAVEDRHIRPAGEDMRAGQLVLARGTVLTAAALGVAVSAGRAEVFVIKRPVAAVFTSGDELVEPGTPLRPGLVRNSNSLCLGALLCEAGCEVVDLGIARDERTDILEGLALARRADILITSGGVSMGDRDLMRVLLEEIGLKVKFWKVNVKPGRPVLFGILDQGVEPFRGIPVFGLPGNPVSTQVTFELFVRPAIRKMMGYKTLFRPVIPVRVKEDIRHAPGRPEFIRVKLKRNGCDYTAEPTTLSQGSGITSSMLDADGLLYLEEDTVVVPKDGEAPCLLLSGKDEEELLL